MVPWLLLLVAPLLLQQAATLPVEKLINLNNVESDLTVPAVTDEKPAAGKRVRQVNSGYESWKLYHVLYLPPEWKVGGKYPVIVEFPGNGGYHNEYGDTSTGRVEDCKLGYGISGGRGFIWVCLPFVDVKRKMHAIQWWGDPDATKDYCRQVVSRVCKEFGGDPDAIILTGFSRGAIACNYIGLRDDETARLWRAMVIHSHYDGVRKWGYPDDDPAAARQRLQRFKGRPQFVTQEMSVEDVRAFLKDSQVKVTLLSLPYPNHSDVWVLKDIPERARLRKWLSEVLKR